MRRKADANAETYVRKGHTPWLRALKRIPIGTEILKNYGADYFSGDGIHTYSTRYRSKSGGM